MIRNPINLLPKQTKAWDFLEDDVTEELGYGGGAGGGKTELGCLIAHFISDQFPRSRGAIGRHSLKNLERTTLASFFEVAEKLGLKADKDYKYNSQKGIIKYKNMSEILVLDTAFKPSDPLYTRFGSLELTWGWVDESNETPPKAIEILNTRVGRKNNNPLWNDKLKQFFGKVDDKGQLIFKPIFLETFNPAKGHIYQRYWKPYKDGKLPEYRQFVRALAKDNPFLPSAYIEKLKRAGGVTTQRLFYGNFDYDDDPQKIFIYDKLNDLFTNTHVEIGAMYLTCDPAGKGKDKTTIYIWSGLQVIHIFEEDETDQKELYEKIRKYQQEYSIPNSNTIVDYNGIGVGVTDFLKCKGFLGGSSPIITVDMEEAGVKANYKNLRSQCYFLLAEKVNESKIYVKSQDNELQNKIVEELDVIKEINDGKDNPRQIIPKGSMREDESRETIRSLLGRSPDHADSLMMRMYFELDNEGELFASVV